MAVAPSETTARPGPAATAAAAEAALRVLHGLSDSSYGPGGRLKLVQSSPDAGAITLTSTSHRLFGAVRMVEPTGKVLLELLAGRQARGWRRK